MPNPVLLEENSYTVSGPDSRPADVQKTAHRASLRRPTEGAPYFFAVQATDEAGNKSLITGNGSTSTDAATLRFATWTPQIGDGGDAQHQKYVAGVGDLNGDGLGDAVIGGREASGFCVVYGHEADSQTGLMDDLVLTGASGTFHTCISQPGSALGSSIVAGGADVNGDGFMDVIASAGFASQGYEEEVQVFLGGATGLSVTPALTITGMNMGFAYGPEVDAGGNFNGDTNPQTGLEVGRYRHRKHGRRYRLCGSRCGFMERDPRPDRPCRTSTV